MPHATCHMAKEDSVTKSTQSVTKMHPFGNLLSFCALYDLSSKKQRR